MIKLKFIEPMYARSVEKLPEGRDWLYEIKLDGYRCLAGRDAKGVILWSRTANIFTTQFPRITKACEQLQPDTLIDGEIVAIDDSGRPSFNLLQHHRSKASAIQFYAFDILIDRGRSLLAVPLETRCAARVYWLLYFRGTHQIQVNNFMNKTQSSNRETLGHVVDVNLGLYDSACNFCPIHRVVSRTADS